MFLVGAGIVRESEVALHEFVEKDGCSLLLRSLQNESPRLRAKAAFLVHCLLRTRPHLQGTHQIQIPLNCLLHPMACTDSQRKDAVSGGEIWRPNHYDDINM